MEDIFIGFSSLLYFIPLGLYLYVLIKLFSEEGIGLGILGLICGIYTFIWGWQNANKLGLRNVMIAWTIFMFFPVFLSMLLSLIITPG